MVEPQPHARPTPRRRRKAVVRLLQAHMHVHACMHTDVHTQESSDDDESASNDDDEGDEGDEGDDADKENLVARMLYNKESAPEAPPVRH